MDIHFTAEEEEFRAEVRDFIGASLPAGMREIIARGQHFEKEHMVRWNRILAEKGWAAPNWPLAHGGTDWTPTQKYIFEEEMGLSAAPALSPFGLRMVGPVIIAFGTEAQKKKYLPNILTGDEQWCQGYSEPGSGSDLSSLKTRAVRDGDSYIVNGQKIWTTNAHFAERMFCLVRTDSSGKQQEGISFILIDMETPGLAVRPIITHDNHHSVNEVFFEDVRVPVENLVGEEGKGWTYAKYLLGHERATIARIGVSKRWVRDVTDFAGRQMANGRPLLEDSGFRRKLSRVEISLKALEITNFRLLAEEQAGGEIGPASSILKIKGSELTQAVSELALEALGYYGFPYLDSLVVAGGNEPPLDPAHEPSVLPKFLYSRAETIFGGSNEIQRNILAKAVLGL